MNSGCNMSTGTTSPDAAQLIEWIASRQAGYSLPQIFYSSDAVYRAELDCIWRRRWLFVGFTCEIAAPGDYFTVEIDGDSIIVIRDDANAIRALHNVCRHRGTLICDQSSGHVGRLVCPYHQWTYARDGELMSCRGMQPDLDKRSLGLVGAAVREVAGMIYICLADDPPPFDDARAMLAPAARPQGMDRAAIAKTVDYTIDANWKLVWENNRECYHCNANHPQYIKANFDHYNADDSSVQIQERIAAAVRRSEEKWAACGLQVTHKQSGMAEFPDPDHDVWYSANRTPMVDDFVSETLDGSQVAPLMGDYVDADVGTLRMRTMPNMWLHASCDHVVSTRLLPDGPARTRARVTWLVAAGAVAGRDYEMDKLLPFWQLTSEQDWELCAKSQRGVMSSRYTPGPLSQSKEYNVDAFIRWYLKELSQA